MSKLEILQIPVLNDNYVYLARDPGSGAGAVAVFAEVRQRKDSF
jgi:hypothetical protein